MKKKIIIAASLALVVVVLIVVLVACSQAAKQDQQEPQNLGAQQTVPVTAEPEETENPEPTVKPTTEPTTEPETEPEPETSTEPETEPTPKPEPENDYIFADVDETVYVINTTIAYSNPSTSSGAVAQLSVGQSFTRTSIGMGAQAGWSRIQFEDGVAYVNGDDLSLIAPAEPSQESTPEPTSPPAPKPAPSQQQPGGGSGGSTQKQPGGTGSGKTQQEEDEEAARRFAEDMRQQLIAAGLDPDNAIGEGTEHIGGIWIE